jgi:hypothetical protein
MSATLQELEIAALALPPAELGALVANLLAHLDGAVGDTPEAIALAWEEEIERRVAAADAGETTATTHREVMSEASARIRQHERR